MLERVQRRAKQMLPKFRDIISYEMRLKECGLTTLETRRLRGVYHACDNIRSSSN